MMVMMVMIMMMMMMSPAGRQGKGGQGSLAWTRQADNLAELVTYGLWPPSSSTSSISSVGHLWLMASNHHQHQFPSAPPPFEVIHVLELVCIPSKKTLSTFNGHCPLNNVYWTKQNIPMMITVKNMRKKAKFDPAPKRADDRPGNGAFCVLSTRKWEQETGEATPIIDSRIRGIFFGRRSAGVDCWLRGQTRESLMHGECSRGLSGGGWGA